MYICIHVYVCIISILSRFLSLPTLSHTHLHVSRPLEKGSEQLYFFIYTHTQTRIHTHTHTHTTDSRSKSAQKSRIVSTCPNIKSECWRTSIQIRMHSYVWHDLFMYIYTFVCIYTHLYMHALIHTNMHTHTHTHIRLTSARKALGRVLFLPHIRRDSWRVSRQILMHSYT